MRYVPGRAGIDEPVCIPSNMAGFPLRSKIDVDAESETPYYYHFDGLGSVVALSNNNGDVVETYSYDVFGNPSTTGSVGNPYFFTGRRYDDEIGLYYYRARYYSPYIGRFLQTDPIGYATGLNLYTYVGNNPVNWVDPYGLKAPGWHTHRNINNRCPKKKPKDGQVDKDDGCGGGNPNPWRADPSSKLHKGNNCYRRRDKKGPGGSQCCYNKGTGILDDTSEFMGTYDYVSPTGPLETLAHGLYDWAPHHFYGGGYAGGLTSTY